MSLASFQIPRRPITYRDETIFEVRGLNVEDLTYLAENYLPDVIKAVEAYGAANQRVIKRSGVAEFVLMAAKDFPTLTAEIISRAADEPDEADKARQLPFPVQLTALKEIVTLSTVEAGGLKNLLAVLVAALENDQPNLLKSSPLRSSLHAIIGASEKTSASS